MVVQGLLQKVLTASPGRDARKCAPYVNIVCTNAASCKLFLSLGFVKHHDVLWAGHKYQPIDF
jgi:hypothetical protein